MANSLPLLIYNAELRRGVVVITTAQSSESKLESSFPDDQFSIPGYRIVRKDRNRNGGRLLSYLNEDNPFKIIQDSSLPPTLEVLPIEIN